MKHFLKKHRYHFGLWFLSAIALIASSWWLNNLNHLNLMVAESDNEPEPPALTAQAADQQLKALPKSSASGNLKNENPKISATTPAPATEGNAGNEDLKTSATTSPEQLKKNIPVAFKIETPDWSKDFTLKVPEGSTVYDAMVQLNDRGLLPIVFKQFAGLGAFVQSIGGVENSAKNNKFWIYYINDKVATLGVSSVKLNPNDIITWKYEASKF